MYTLKSLIKHRIRHAHFGLMELTIQFGMAIDDGYQRITLFYDDRSVFSSWFQVSLKSNFAGDEIWVRTFHKVRYAEVERRVRRATLIRGPKW